ncbi:hypothetical protein N7495_007628 [Penicillium taxi]|uniref:uncharacterized protein n=1 Tax=Penicillium taxi TaxID=168475 RepID=UPI0025458CDD|nr:uncharacterized protein N7495_007628 [Penicillium taxi]KAJ5887587.1 hypothetical protein N7495_007628 [Penicillium taxi]
MGQRSKVLDTDGPTPKFLYAILKQLDLKSVRRIDWNKVASDLEISNGHAARMRYSRFRNQMEPSAHKTKKKSAKKQQKGDPSLGMNNLYPSSSAHLQFQPGFAVKIEESFDSKYPHSGYYQPPHLTQSGVPVEIEPGYHLNQSHLTQYGEPVKMKTLKTEFSPKLVKREPSQTNPDTQAFAESSDSDSWPQVISVNCPAYLPQMHYPHDVSHSMNPSIPPSMPSSSSTPFGPFYSPFRIPHDGMDNYGFQHPVFSNSHVKNWEQSVASKEVTPPNMKTNTPPVERKVKPEIVIEIDDFQTA